MNYCPVTDGQTDGRTESDAYEPTVQHAQVGSKSNVINYREDILVLVLIDFFVYWVYTKSTSQDIWYIYCYIFTNDSPGEDWAFAKTILPGMSSTDQINYISDQYRQKNRSVSQLSLA